jgi:hypothetical protein
VALTKKMAASKQSRAPARAASPAPAETVEVSPPPGAVLYIRLWGAEIQESSSASLKAPGPPSCLTLDMISACGGSVSETSGEVLVARFPAFQDAALAARRLQWAAQGLSEAQSFNSTAVAILVQSEDDAISPEALDASVYALAQGSAGQILFTPKAARFAESLPGFVFEGGGQAELLELQWRGSGGQHTQTSDDELIARLIEKKGPEAKARAYPVRATDASTNVPGPAELVANTRQTTALTGGGSTGIFHQPRARMLWIGGAALCAALLLAAIPVFHLFRPSASPTSVSAPEAAAGSETGAPPAGAAPSQASSSPVPSSEVASAEPERAAAAASQAASSDKPKEKKDRSTARDDHVKSKPAAAQNGSQPRKGCDLDQDEVHAQLEQAESSQARGKYKDAQRQFESVLACDPANSRALSGLRTVRQAELLNQ